MENRGPDRPSSALCILNPASAAGRTGLRADDLVALVRSLPTEIELHATTGPGHASEMAARLGGTHPMVIVIGGDGTVSEVANGLLAAGHDPVVAVLPAGSGSDYARNLGITGTERALQALAGRRESRVDVGRAVLAGPHGRLERYFVLTTGTGFSPRVIDRATKRLKRLFRSQTYTAASILAALAYRVPRMHVIIDGDEYDGPFFNVVVAKAELESGGARMSPGARLDDGFLWVGACRERRALSGLRCMAGVFRGDHVRSPSYVYRSARQASIESDPPVGVQVDGETPGRTPVEFGVVPGRLRVLVPPGEAGG